MQMEQSGGLQISSPRGVRTANPEEEFQRLFQEHVERPRPAREKRLWREGSRPWIHARLSEAIQRHALWDRLSRDVPVEEFTAPGDGFRIDFAYRPNGGVPDGRLARWGANGVTKYLHAISLERDWNQSKLLCYTFWRIREKTKAQMTAIVADADPDNAAVAKLPPDSGRSRDRRSAALASRPVPRGSGPGVAARSGKQLEIERSRPMDLAAAATVKIFRFEARPSRD